MNVLEYRFVFKISVMNKIVKMAGNEELYQASFTKNCATQEKAKKLMGKGGSNYTNVHYVFLANFGGKVFSKDEALYALEATPGPSFFQGTAIKEILNDSMRFGILHIFE